MGHNTETGLVLMATWQKLVQHCGSQLGIWFTAIVESLATPLEPLGSRGVARLSSPHYGPLCAESGSGL
jgi:hypothetical protein